MDVGGEAQIGDRVACGGLFVCVKKAGGQEHLPQEVVVRGRFVFVTTRLDTNCLEAMVGRRREAQWQEDDISLAREDQERRTGWKRQHAMKRTQQPKIT